MDKILILENRIKELERKFSLLENAGTIPKNIVDALSSRGFLLYDGDIVFEGGVSGNVFNNIFVKYTNQKFILQLPYPLKRFTVNTSTEVCTSVGHQLADGNNIQFYTTDTLPAGLDSLISTYAVLNATADTFQVTTDGVNPVDITSVGVGVQYVQVY